MTFLRMEMMMFVVNSVTLTISMLSLTSLLVCRRHRIKADEMYKRWLIRSFMQSDESLLTRKRPFARTLAE